MIMGDLALNERSWFHFAMEQSHLHAEEFRLRPLNDDRTAFFQAAALQSVQEQTRIEQASEPDFEVFLRQYFQQYQDLYTAPS